MHFVVDRIVVAKSHPKNHSRAMYNVKVINLSLINQI